MSTTAFSNAFRSRNLVMETSLADLTTLRVGGPATVVTLCELSDLEVLAAQGPLQVLGRGANLLADDAPLPGPVLRLGRPFSDWEDLGGTATTRRMRLGAGLDLAQVLARCAREGLGGLEGLAGVPGTVGGAMIMNAGTPAGWFLDHLVAAQVVRPGQTPQWLGRQELAPAYRHGGFPQGTLILAGELELPLADPAEVAARQRGLREAKASKQPLSAASAGCFFRNPPEIPAGRLLDELGCKGWREGGAMVSLQHANFLINAGGATAADFHRLVRRLRHQAWTERGLVLDLEVVAWGGPDWLHIHPKELVCSST